MKYIMKRKLYMSNEDKIDIPDGSIGVAWDFRNGDDGKSTEWVYWLEPLIEE